MRLWIFMIALVISTPNYANAGEGAEQPLDMTGAVVDWTGQIIRQYRNAEDTCFDLQSPDHKPGRFKTCVFGYYDPAQFGSGKWLTVKGILQPGNSSDVALVLGAKISLTQPPLPPRRYAPDPWYNPGYDPFFHPHRLYQYW